MTVLVTLEHARLDAVATVPEEVTTIGESTIFLREGERIPVRDLIEAALIPSANDAADTLAYYVGHGSQARFVAMMNAKARRLGLRDTHFVRPDGLDAPGHVSSARDVTKLARILMRRPVVRRIVARDQCGHRGRTDDLHAQHAALFVSRPLRRQDRPHRSRRLVGGRRGAPERRDRLRDDPRLALRGAAGRRSRLAADLGPVAVPARDPDRRRRRVRPGGDRLRPRLRQPRRPASARPPRSGRAAAGREGRRAADARSSGHGAGRRSARCAIYSGGRLVGARPLVAARSVSAPGFADRAGWYIGRTFSNLFGWF